MSLVTQHAVVKRGALTWDRGLLPEAAYRRRIATLQSRMAETGEDAWLLFGDVQAHGPVVWATNFMPRVRSALAFVPRAGEPTLFANISTRDIPAAKTITWVADIEAFSRLPKSLAGFITAKLPADGKVGTCGIEQSMPVVDWRSIEAELPHIRFASRDAELNALRENKEPREVEAVRRAGYIANQALARAGAELRAGRTMRQAMAQVDLEARSRGAEDVRFLVASGPEAGVALGPVNDRVLTAGDAVLIYVAVQNQRYWAEAGSTFVLGTPEPGMVDLHRRAWRALEAMRSAAKADVQTSEIAAAANAALGALANSANSYGLGHAIGLDARETPLVTTGDTSRLSANATLALRVIVHAGGRGVALAGTVHISDKETMWLAKGNSNLVQLTT